MGKDTILIGLEREIGQEDGTKPKPLPVDRWIAASVLQKAIRRNDPKTAMRAAFTLFHQDRRVLWRRIAVIALEDVGAASPGAIVKTLAVCHDPACRAKIGDLKTALHVIRLLCSSVKIRLADEVFSIADRAPEYRKFREILAKAGNRYLSDYVLDDNRPFPERCLALWFLAGTNRYPSDV